MIINFNDINKKRIKEVKDENFDYLWTYNPKSLFNSIKYDNVYRDKIIDFLFYKATSSNKVEEFKEVLKECKLYYSFVRNIVNSFDFKKITHLALYYENSLIDEMFFSEISFIKFIFRNIDRYDFKYIDYSYQICKIAKKERTLRVLRNLVIKQFYKEKKRQTKKNNSETVDLLMNFEKDVVDNINYSITLLNVNEKNSK